MLRQLDRASLLHQTFDAPYSRSSTLTLFTVKPMDWCKYWPLPTIAASLPIGRTGFESLQVFLEVCLFGQILTCAVSDAVLAASIFHYGEYTVQQAKQRMRERGIPVRL